MFFTIVGKLIKSKEEKAYVESAKSEKGSFLTFNCMASAKGNLVFLQSQYWKSKQYKKDKVYTVNNEGEFIEVPIDKKDDPELLKTIPEYKKFVIDKYPSGYVYGLKKLVDSFDEASDEDKAKFKVTTLEEAKTKYEKAKKGRYEFIDVEDFTEALKNWFAKDPNIENGKWVITGERTMRPYVKDGKKEWATSYTIHKIQKAYDNSEESATVSDKLLFTDESIVETAKGLTITGYSIIYMGKDKETKEKLPNEYCPISFTVSTSDEKKCKGIKKRFEIEEGSEEVKQMGVVLNILNGAEKVEFTEDMLTDADKENIEWGLTTFEEIQKERSAYGESRQGFEFAKLGKGYSTYEETAYTKDTVLGKASKSSDDDDDDLDFGDLGSFEDISSDIL